VVEAMAHGLPVIVSDQVGIQQEIARYQAGLVTPCTHDDLAWALLQLADNYETRQRMGANGRQLSLTRFSPAVTTAKLVKLYTGLLRSHLQEVTV
jgi:glycosyltransferase involved in cell wall biosynthesis